MKPPLWPWVLGSMVPSGVPQQDGTGGAKMASRLKFWGHCCRRVSARGITPQPRPHPLGCHWAPSPSPPQRSPHSHHPGSPCGPAFDGTCSACGHCYRHGRYLEGQRDGVRSGAAGNGRGWHPVSHHHHQGGLAVGTAGGLTRWEATSKEHVEEVFRGDVSFKAAVEVPVPMAVPGCLALVIAELVILLPFLWVAKYCVCCANG